MKIYDGSESSAQMQTIQIPLPPAHFTQFDMARPSETLIRRLTTKMSGYGVTPTFPKSNHSSTKGESPNGPNQQSPQQPQKRKYSNVMQYPPNNKIQNSMQLPLRKSTTSMKPHQTPQKDEQPVEIQNVYVRKQINHANYVQKCYGGPPQKPNPLKTSIHKKRGSAL